MAQEHSELGLLSELDKELVNLVDHFSNLMAAARPPAEDEAGQPGAGPRDRRPPGDMLEVFGEKLLLSAHKCVHQVGQLKKFAMLSDFDALVANVRDTRTIMQQMLWSDNVLRSIKADALALLNDLEEHYYASRYKGMLPPNEPSEAMQELSQLALQAAGPAPGAAGAAPGAGTGPPTQR